MIIDAYTLPSFFRKSRSITVLVMFTKRGKFSSLVHPVQKKGGVSFEEFLMVAPSNYVRILVF